MFWEYMYLELVSDFSELILIDILNLKLRVLRCKRLFPPLLLATGPSPESWEADMLTTYSHQQTSWKQLTNTKNGEQYPVALYEELVKMFSKEHDVVIEVGHEAAEVGMCRCILCISFAIFSSVNGKVHISLSR